jgi:transcriptional regulator with XRE-family HTH domain
LLRQLRVDAGLTQEELAHAASLSPRSVSDLERGINRTTRNLVRDLGMTALSGPSAVIYCADLATGLLSAEDIGDSGCPGTMSF